MSERQLDPLAGTKVDTFLVSGHPRSGTSMMMHALSMGGLESAHTPALDDLAANRNGYVQNPKGFFELSLELQRHPWFPMRHWGKLIKVQFVQLCGLAPGRYKVVFMLRDPREIRMSYEAMGPQSANLQLGWDEPKDYLPLMKRFIAAASMRVDMQLIEVWFHDVLGDPLATFQRIRDFGVPIDPAKAAEAVEPDLYRHRVALSERGQETQSS